MSENFKGEFDLQGNTIIIELRLNTVDRKGIPVSGPIKIQIDKPLLFAFIGKTAIGKAVSEINYGEIISIIFKNLMGSKT